MPIINMKSKSFKNRIKYCFFLRIMHNLTCFSLRTKHVTLKLEKSLVPKKIASDFLRLKILTIFFRIEFQWLSSEWNTGALTFPASLLKLFSDFAKIKRSHCSCCLDHKALIVYFSNTVKTTFHQFSNNVKIFLKIRSRYVCKNKLNQRCTRDIWQWMTRGKTVTSK